MTRCTVQILDMSCSPFEGGCEAFPALILDQVQLLSYCFSKVKQNKTKQNKTKQNKTKQNKTKQNKTKQNKTKQNKTKQNKTKQNKTKQNKTNQNKSKQIKTTPQSKEPTNNKRIFRLALKKGSFVREALVAVSDHLYIPQK